MTVDKDPILVYQLAIYFYSIIILCFANLQYLVIIYVIGEAIDIGDFQIFHAHGKESKKNQLSLKDKKC